MADDEKSGSPAHHHHHHQMAVQADPATSLGVYANLMMVSHRKEEFILDFLFVPPQQAGANQTAALRSRVITTPEHAKRIVRALQENVQRYEAAFGPISEATDLPRNVH
ncbi:MAG: DUF3467 domain-containing protein [Deltaproteobacteria bacterium]|nr:DUF3467 domain-containing protein [Deltaproteobacteria bacterium]